jgi:hypothetical protein
MTLKRALLDGYASSTLVRLYELDKDKQLGKVPIEETVYFVLVIPLVLLGLQASRHNQLNVHGQYPPIQIFIYGISGVSFCLGLLFMAGRIFNERKFVKACLSLHELIYTPGCLEIKTLVDLSNRYLIDKAINTNKLWAMGKCGAEHDTARAYVQRSFNIFKLFGLNSYEISNYYRLADQEIEALARQSRETDDEPVILGAMPDDRPFPR